MFLGCLECAANRDYGYCYCIGDINEQPRALSETECADQSAADICSHPPVISHTVAQIASPTQHLSSSVTGSLKWLKKKKKSLEIK